MGRRSGPTLAGRGVLPARLGPPPPRDATADKERRGHAVVTRHCWVSKLPDCAGRWAGLLVEWRQDPESGRWAGRVVYVVDDAGRGVLVETLVDADHLWPARTSRRHRPVATRTRCTVRCPIRGSAVRADGAGWGRPGVRWQCRGQRRARRVAGHRPLRIGGSLPSAHTLVSDETGHQTAGHDCGRLPFAGADTGRRSTSASPTRSRACARTMAGRTGRFHLPVPAGEPRNARADLLMPRTQGLVRRRTSRRSAIRFRWSSIQGGMPSVHGKT
jgi:hypothetical protein